MKNTVSTNENIETYSSKSSSANKHCSSVNKTSNVAEETIDTVAKTKNERTSSSTSAFNKRKSITTIANAPLQSPKMLEKSSRRRDDSEEEPLKKTN